MFPAFGVGRWINGVASALPGNDTKTSPVAEVSDGNCTVTETALEGLKAEASKVLAKAIDSAFLDFPADRTDLKRQFIAKFLTKENLCAVAMGDAGITKNSHNIVRKRLMGDKLDPKAARKMGVIASNIPLKAVCDGWKPSHSFVGVRVCEDVTAEYEGGLPSVMYATELAKDAALNYLADPQSAPYYTKYQNSGPVACKSPNARTGEYVAYHSQNVSAVYTLDFIMRAIRGENFLAWTLLDSCKTSAGKELNYDDLKFDSGVRAFLDFPVIVDGAPKTLTLMITGVAAASNSSLSGIISKETARQRYYSGESAKKILLDAKSHGWTIEK